jgi:hemerythrin
MSLFQWSEEFSVGRADIDSQHKRLFQLADQLEAAMTAGRGKQVLGNTLNNLVAYTKRHFADEEVLMQLHRYPGSSLHKAEHQALAEKLVQFQRAFAADRATVTIELLQSLHNSMMQHIKGTDRKIADYLRQQVR